MWLEMIVVVLMAVVLMVAVLMVAVETRNWNN